MLKIIFTSLLMLFVLRNASASLYEVTNYVGKIGSYQIHFSIQKSDSNFGSGITVEGNYYYDNHMSPIPIYGKYNSLDEIELCEIHDDNEFDKIVNKGTRLLIDSNFCEFKLKIEKDSAYGTWTSKGKVFDVKLRLVSTLNNSRKSLTHGIVEVPYWGQSKNYIFIGVYEGVGSGVVMNKIVVINKLTKVIVQEIYPKLHDCDAGFFMTQIYKNVESDKINNTENIKINCFDPKGASYAYYSFNDNSKKFEFSFLN